MIDKSNGDSYINIKTSISNDKAISNVLPDINDSKSFEKSMALC